MIRSRVVKTPKKFLLRLNDQQSRCQRATVHTMMGATFGVKQIFRSDDNFATPVSMIGEDEHGISSEVYEVNRNAGMQLYSPLGEGISPALTIASSPVALLIDIHKGRQQAMYGPHEHAPLPGLGGLCPLPPLLHDLVSDQQQARAKKHRSNTTPSPVVRRASTRSSVEPKPLTIDKQHDLVTEPKPAYGILNLFAGLAADEAPFVGAIGAPPLARIRVETDARLRVFIAARDQSNAVGEWHKDPAGVLGLLLASTEDLLGNSCLLYTSDAADE